MIDRLGVLLLACIFTNPLIGQAQMIVAHRGASYDAPENTLAAFREAWQQQADGIEGDFYVTQDQEIVCIHDKDTLRTGGQKLAVAECTLAQLRQLEYGSWKSKKFMGEPLPTFSEVLAEMPADKLFVIELKTGPEIVSLLKQALAESQHHQDRLLIIAFNSATVAECKKLLPEIRVHWLTGYKLNEATGKFHPTAAEIASTLKSCSADGLGMQGERRVVTPEFISQLKGQGLREFHVWTVDNPEDARYFQGLGAIGITTNRPGLLREALSQ